MKKFEEVFKFISEKTVVNNNQGTKVVKEYEGEHHRIKEFISTSKDGEVTIRVDVLSRRVIDGYVADIYINENYFTDEIEGFEISTTTYGFLSKEEISDVVKGLKIAQEVVEVLEEKYLGGN